MFLQIHRLQRSAAALAAVLSTAGCALVDDHAQQLLASRTVAHAAIGTRLLQGEAAFNQPRAGSVHVHSADHPALDCAGTLHLTGSTGGVASLHCSDGRGVEVPFQLLGALRAAGIAYVGDTRVALTYGLPPSMAAPYLGVPMEQVPAAAK